MTSLEGCIRFWESKLIDKGLYSPATMALIETTVKFLKELQKIQSTNDLTIK